jgi:hypothetical protein
MDPTYCEQLIAAWQHLASQGVQFAAGLSDDEIQAVERRFSLRIPPDLRSCLQSGLPVGPGFPDWRGSDEAILERLRWPAEGICFDVGNGVFWWPEWGARPGEGEEAVAIAMRHLRSLPALIPIYRHSYLPGEPHSSENPVFSIHQADVIHRGRNLAEYLLWLHHDPEDDAIEQRYPAFDPSYKAIPFWTELARANYS